MVSTEHVPTRVHRHQLRQNLSLSFAVHECASSMGASGKLYDVVKVKVKGRHVSVDDPPPLPGPLTAHYHGGSVRPNGLWHQILRLLDGSSHLISRRSRRLPGHVTGQVSWAFKRLLCGQFRVPRIPARVSLALRDVCFNGIMRPHIFLGRHVDFVSRYIASIRSARTQHPIPVI